MKFEKKEEKCCCLNRFVVDWLLRNMTTICGIINLHGIHAMWFWPGKAVRQNSFKRAITNIFRTTNYFVEQNFLTLKVMANLKAMPTEIRSNTEVFTDLTIF